MSERPNVLVTRPIMDERDRSPARAVRRHRSTRTSSGSRARSSLEVVRGRDAIITMLTERVDAELLAAAGPQLKIVANHAVGFDNIDVPACTAAGVLATNTPDVLTETTADTAFALADGRRPTGGRGRALPAGADPVDLGTADDARTRRPPQDDRDRRVRTDRAGRRSARQGVRDARDLRRRRSSSRPRSRPRPAPSGVSWTICSPRPTSSRSTRTSRPRRGTCSTRPRSRG